MFALRRPHQRLFSSTTSRVRSLPKDSIPDFTNGQAVYEHKSTAELMRALAVLRLCGVKSLVDNAPQLMNFGEKIIGKRGLALILRSTFFGHFCAGEDQGGIRPTVAALETAGIGSILDYAAEADEASFSAAVDPDVSDRPVAREYHYVGEEGCDRHVGVFKECIESVHAVSPTGFAAIKVTALGPPELLKRVSSALVEVRRLFEEFDQDHDGTLTVEEFKEGYQRFFVLDDTEHEDLEQLLKASFPTPHAAFEAGAAPVSTATFECGDGQRRVDYVEWCNLLKLEHLTKLTGKCRHQGPLSKAVLTERELEAYHNLLARVDSLAALAARKGVRLMVDAEQTYFQPAIDHIVYSLQQKYNSNGSPSPSGGGDPDPAPPQQRCTIFSTYQCYLVDANQRLQTDLSRAQRFNYNFGAKLVRGAYLVSERERAAAMGYADPVQPTLEATHASYHRAVDLCLDAMVREQSAESRGSRTEFMVASHNQETVEYVLGRVGQLEEGRGRARGEQGDGGDHLGGGEEGDKAAQLDDAFSLKKRVYFGQLLGMSDHLTFLLGGGGWQAYKYVPFGPVHEVMPYLLRRAQENSALLGAAQGAEVGMLRGELRRRLLAAVGFTHKTDASAK